MESQKSQAELSKEKLAEYDRMLSVLVHPEWREIYLFFNDYAVRFQSEMNNASNWDEFVAARVCKQFVEQVCMPLPALIKGAKEELERQLADEALDAAMDEEPGA